MMPGFPTRLKEDLVERYDRKVSKGNKSSVKIRIIDSPSRKYNVFIGASIIAKTTEDYPEAWVTKKLYDEKGKTRLAKELASK